MARVNEIVIVDPEGMRGTVVPEDWPTDRGTTQYLVRLESGRHIVVSADALTVQEDGTYRLPVRFADLEEPISKHESNQGRRVVPVMTEEVEVDRRRVETGRVRLTKKVHEREEVVDEPVLREEVHIERVPVGKMVKEGPVSSYYDGNTLVIPVVKEVLVVEKRLMVEEELRVTKKKIRERSPQHVTLRSEEVVVERIESSDEPVTP